MNRATHTTPGDRQTRTHAHYVATALLAAVAFFAASAQPAEALSVTQTYGRTVAFAGTGCERITKRVALPLRTRTAFLVAPRVGDALHDLDDQVVATIVEARLDQSDGRRVIAVTVQGAAAMCAKATPDAPAATANETAWEAEVDVTARLRRSVQVYFPQVCCYGRHDLRPRTLFLGASFFLDRVRWRSWGRSTARGTAQLPWNSCQPSCAAGHVTWIPARVLLSRPRLCNGVYQYLTVRYTMTRKPPSGSRKGAWHFGFRCE